MTCARKIFKILPFLKCSGSAFHIAGPLYAKEFSKRARGACGTIAKLEEVDVLVSLTSIPVNRISKVQIVTLLVNY